MNQQRNCFFEINCNPVKDSMKTTEMTIKNVEYSIILFYKAAVGLEESDSNFERSSPVGIIPSHSILSCREIICKRKSQLTVQVPLSYF